MLRQRQLHENAVHVGIVVEIVDQLEQVPLAGLGRQLVLVGIHAGLDGLLALAAHVDLARRVLARRPAPPRAPGSANGSA